MFYITNAARRIAIRREGRPLDLTTDPPPDIAIEVDISRPEVPKRPIYAAMGVPEIWSCDGVTVAYLIRTPDGQYVASDRSSAFPDLPVAWVNEALAIGLSQSQRAAVAEVRRRASGG